MVGKITTTWGEVMNWLYGAIGDAEALFYSESGLTFLGTLSVIGVGIGVCFLIIGVIQNFLKLRG